MVTYGKNIGDALMEEMHRLNHTKYINILISGDVGMIPLYQEMLGVMRKLSRYQLSMLRFFISDDRVMPYHGNSYQELGEKSQYLQSRFVDVAVSEGLLDQAQVALYYSQQRYESERDPGLEILNRRYFDLGMRIDIALLLTRYDGSFAGMDSACYCHDWDNKRYFWNPEYEGPGCVTCSLKMVRQASLVCSVAAVPEDVWCNLVPDLSGMPDRNFVTRCGRVVPCPSDRQEFFDEERIFPFAATQFCRQLAIMFGQPMAG
ncbi:MAG: hypothetical protein PHC51_09135 [bacterium]|nr:hypothetical protein [bacterium]